MRRATNIAQYSRHLRRSFLSTLSLRRATIPPAAACGVNTNFYPRSPCGERPYGRINDISRLIFLSTLSLRRATEYWVGGYGTANNFYPRSPCGERLYNATSNPVSKLFLSTLSLRRATRAPFVALYTLANFYPRSPCGERHRGQNPPPPTGTISIHALLAESDLMWYQCNTVVKEFLSTLSLRRATCCCAG